MANNNVTFTFRIKNAFGRGLTALRNGFSNLRNNMLKSKIATNALSVAFGVGLASAVRKLKDAIVGTIAATAALEKQLANVKTLLSPEDVAKYGKELENTAKEALKLGFSIEDTGKAMFDTISAGVKAGKATEFFRQAQRLAIGGVTDIGIAVDGLTSVMNAYGRENFDATKASNVFFTAQKDGKTTVAELASSIGQVAPVAAKVGVSFEETASALSTLTTSGVRTDLAVTGLKAALSGLASPSEDARKAMRKYGIPVGVAELKSKGFGFALKKINEAFLENNDSITKLFPNIRAFLAVAGLTEGALDRYDNTLNKTRTDTTSLTNAVKTQTDTLDFQWNALKGTIKTISISIMGEFVPALKWLTKTMKQTADFWSKTFGKLFGKQKTEIEETTDSIAALTAEYNALQSMQFKGIGISKNRLKVIKAGIDIEIAKLKKLKQAQADANKESAKGVGAKAPGAPVAKPKVSDTELRAALKDFAKREQALKTHRDALTEISKAKNQEDLDELREQFQRERDLNVEELERQKEFLDEKNLLTLEKKQELDAAIEATDTEHKARLKALDDAETSGKIKKGKILSVLESKRSKQLQGHFNTIASLQNSHNAALAAAGKAAAIANATMTTAAGVARALMDFPFPASIAIGGLVAVAGAAQIASIAGVQFATGTADVPRDMAATVHQGEIIVPKTFADSLRTGDLSLSGRGENTTNNDNAVNVNISVQGSVIGGTPTEIAREIHNMISKDISAGTLIKFPTEGA
jgi:TP901 family phage tail tape measure protein